MSPRPEAPQLLPDTPDASISRILQSRTFASAPSSRRLLKYLAERTASADPDLKEYSIGIDVFGKAPSYDPQRDSTVRIQVGRLRQKLSEYYSGEGAAESIRFEIPKGSFRLSSFEPPQELLSRPSPLNHKPPFAHWRSLALLATFLFLASVSFNLWDRFRPNSALPAPVWSSDLEKLWGPLLTSQRPLLIAFSTPLFAEFQGKFLFRDRAEEVWDDLSATSTYSAVLRALGTPPSRPTHYYAAAGEVGSAFSLAKTLSPRKQNIALVRDVQLSWQQLADNNVLFLGAPRFFRDKLGDLPLDLEILADSSSFRVLHPRPGEPASFPKNGVQGDGETYALVTNSSGPGGKGNIISFMSNDTFGRQGAVQSFTDPEFARRLVSKLTSPSGRFPLYYQVMLRIKLKGGITTEIDSVLVRELTLRSQR